MPAFIAPADFDRWLDCDAVPAEEAAALIKPADEALLEVYPISPAVNRVANDSEVLIAPLSAQAEQSARRNRRSRTESKNRTTSRRCFSGQLSPLIPA